MSFSSRVFLFSALAIAAAPAVADYPKKTIELVVPFKAGGETDIAARIFSECLAKKLPVQMRVKNVMGALSQNGSREVKDARPDGYKLLWTHQMLNMIEATGVADYNYTAFAPVASTAYENMGLFSAKTSDISDWESLKKRAEEDPKSVSISFAFNGFTHFSAADFFENTDINLYDLKTVPGGGAKDRIVKTIRGDFELIPIGISAAQPYLKSGDLQAVAIQSQERDPTQPDAKTAIEQGVDSDFTMVFTVYAPKGTPQENIDVLAKAFQEAAQEKTCTDKLERHALFADVRVGDELDGILSEQVERYKKLAEKYNLNVK